MEKLLEKYPNDSLASLALYKLSTIYLNWQNDPASGLGALDKLVKTYPESKQAKQAKLEIEEFPDYILNKTESLRKKEMVKEALDHLMYLVLVKKMVSVVRLYQYGLQIFLKVKTLQFMVMELSQESLFILMICYQLIK